MGSRVHPEWTELPPECLLGIFSRLTMGQRRNGPMLVCKTWTNLCQDPSLNTILDLEAEFLSSPDCIYWWSPEFEEKVNSTIRSVVDQSEGGLKEIRVRHCTNQSLSYVAERYTRLGLIFLVSGYIVIDADRVGFGHSQMKHWFLIFKIIKTIICNICSVCSKIIY